MLNRKTAGQLPHASDDLGGGVVGDDRTLAGILDKGVDAFAAAEGRPSKPSTSRP